MTFEARAESRDRWCRGDISREGIPNKRARAREGSVAMGDRSGEGNRESPGSSRSKIALGKVEAKKGREIEGRGAVHAAEWQWTISAPTEAAIGVYC